jgi:hypothetical protein
MKACDKLRKKAVWQNHSSGIRKAILRDCFCGRPLFFNRSSNRCHRACTGQTAKNPGQRNQV